MTAELGISIVPYADSVERSRELVPVADEGGLRLVDPGPPLRRSSR
jgi:hypothetical protein